MGTSCPHEHDVRLTGIFIGYLMIMVYDQRPVLCLAWRVYLPEQQCGASDDVAYMLSTAVGRKSSAQCVYDCRWMASMTGLYARHTYR